jgi:DNA sulfur modification protein DndE
MSSFTFSRIRFNTKADNALRTLAGRTGLRANVLCRIALACSLALPDPPPEVDESDMSTREINRHTLFGDTESLFYTLLANEGSGSDLPSYCIEHIHRGIYQLLRKLSTVRKVSDISCNYP